MPAKNRNTAQTPGCFIPIIDARSCLAQKNASRYQMAPIEPIPAGSPCVSDPAPYRAASSHPKNPEAELPIAPYIVPIATTTQEVETYGTSKRRASFASDVLVTLVALQKYPLTTKKVAR